MNFDSRISADSPEAMATQMDNDPVRADGESRRRRLALIALGLLGAFLAITAYVVFSGKKGASADELAQIPAITVVAPGKTKVIATISAPGTLAARREIPVGVVGEGGRVARVLVDAGQWVRKGQALAVIDRSVQSQQARAAKAQAEAARADAQLAQNNLDRALKLVERGFVSKADVDRLTATRDAALARARAAEAQYRELLARNARLDILAPAGGLVLERNVEPGQTVSAGSPPLFRIAKGGEIELKAKVGEAELARLSTGAPAEVTPVGSERSFSGQIWQIAPTIDPSDRQGHVRIALAYAPQLRPGGFATAQIRAGTLSAPVLPESAILSDRDGAFVYVVGKDNKAERRRVRTGDVVDGGIVITEGLDGGELVVLRAGGFLSPGDKIRPVKPGQ